MSFSCFSRNEVIQHVFIWLFIYLHLYIEAPQTSHYIYEALGCFFSILNFAILYYMLLCFILPNLWEKKKWLLFPVFICLFALYFSIKWVNGNYLIHFADIYSPPGRLQRYLKVAILFFIPISIMAFSAFFRRKALLEIQEGFEREKQLLQDELSFLKTQFNSHLTFNFLNFLYSRALSNSERVANAIEHFSEMLRYSLRIKPGKEVFVRQELDHIANYIELERAFKGVIFISKRISEAPERQMILPRVLLTFVENAFEQGIFNDPDRPIEIVFEARPQTIYFQVSYWMNQIKDISESSFNQEIRKYLSAYYNRCYSLEYSVNALRCISKLTLNTISPGAAIAERVN
jgi:two-component system LytT family sensor kinase